MNRVLMQLRQCGGADDVRVNLPQPRYADKADIVVSGEGLSHKMAEQLDNTLIETAEYVPQARVLNIRFTEHALFAAIANWSDEVLTARDRLPTGEELFYSVQYAHYRARHLAADNQHWDCDIKAARKLAVALVLFAQQMHNCKELDDFKQVLTGFVQIYNHWHESLLQNRAANIHSLRSGQTNGELTQKEAIQYPVSSALLARATAMALQNAIS